MKRFSQQLHTKSKSVKLQASERRELRERVVSYMEYHPLPNSVKTAKSIPTPFYIEAFKMVHVPFSTFAKWSTVAAALVLIILPIVAENSVPGDGLYAVKGFTEDVRSTLNFTPYQKIEWETERLNRRIAEARLLASEGRLTDEVEAEVAEAVKFHTENAQREIEELRTEDEDEATLATIALSTTLQVQSASLREEEPEDGPVGEENKRTNLLANVIDETLSKQEVSNAFSAVPSYDKLMARVELNTTRSYELLASLNLSPNDESYKDVTRRIEDIERSVQEAINLKDSDDEAARSTLVGVMQRTQKLIVFMTEIEVSRDFNVEEVVPVILTVDEQESGIKKYRDEIGKQIETIESNLKSSTDNEVNEKATYSLSALKESQSKIASSTAYAEVKASSEEALSLARDTLTLIERGAQVKATTTGSMSSENSEAIKASTTLSKDPE